MRLIDADALNKIKFHELPYTHIVPADLLKLQTEAYERGWNDAIDAIMESADTIDAEPVRHGRWEPYEFGDDTWHKCSVCGTADKYINIVVRKGFADVRLVSKRNYCPICGAKMDEAEP